MKCYEGSWEGQMKCHEGLRYEGSWEGQMKCHEGLRYEGSWEGQMKCYEGSWVLGGPDEVLGGVSTVVLQGLFEGQGEGVSGMTKLL